MSRRSVLALLVVLAACQGPPRAAPDPPRSVEPPPEEEPHAEPEPAAEEPEGIPAELARGERVTWLAATPELAVARIFVSEAGWDGEEDHRAIFQVLLNIRRRGERPAMILDAAQRMSSRATGVRPAHRARMRWIASLGGSDERPRGWVECGSQPCTGRWEDYVERWRAVRALAASLVRGAPVRSPCPGRPIAWGAIIDDWIAIRRGLERVKCNPATLNRFWQRPRR